MLSGPRPATRRAGDDAGPAGEPGADDGPGTAWFDNEVTIATRLVTATLRSWATWRSRLGCARPPTLGYPSAYRLGAQWNIICLTPGERFVSTVEAARTLGVTVQHVRRLADSGELTRIARGLIDRASLERYLAARQGGRTRVWAETAWGAIRMLSGMHAEWLGPTQASRVRARLREITDPAGLVAQTRDRAVVSTYAGHPSALRRLMDELVTTEASGLGLVGSRPDSVNGYLAPDALDSTVRFFGLCDDPAGNVTIRAANFDIDVVRDLAIQGTVLAALHAATSRDPRERGVGERALADALDRYRQ